VLRRRPEDIDNVIKSCEGVNTGPTYYFNVEGQTIVAHSIPDAVAKALKILSGAEVTNDPLGTIGELICPSCLNQTAVRTGSCLVCLRCGYSTC